MRFVTRSPASTTRRVPSSHPNRSSFATEIPTFVIPASA